MRKKIPYSFRTFYYVVIAAILYFLMGRLGLLLALPPGFASILWPASGLALGLFLSYGKKILPGIWFGSFLVNSVSKDWSFNPSWVTVAIAAGACLQVYAVSMLLRKRDRQTALFLKSQSIIYFFIVVAPFSCLLSSSIGIGALVLAGKINHSEILLNWSTWFIGDTLGVMLFTPLVMLVLGRNKPEWASRLKYLLPSALICTTAFSLFFYYAAIREEEKISARVGAEASEIGFLIEAKVVLYEKLILGIVGLYRSSDEVTDREFQSFIKTTTKGVTGFTGIAWVPRLLPGQVSAFKAWLEKQGIYDFKIRNLPNTPLHENSQEDFLYPITFLSNRKYIGFRGLNLASDPSRLMALKEAEESEKPFIIPRVRFLNTEENETGTILVQPIVSPLSHSRLDRIKGFVFFSFQPDQAFAEAIHRADSLGFDLELKDEAGQILLDTAREKGSLNNLKKDRRVNWAGEQWLVSLGARQNYIAQNRSWDTWAILTIGLFFCAVIQIFIFILTGSNYQIGVQVEERTKELDDSRKNLVAAKDEAVRANHAKSVFLATMSHEIRTPLNGIVGITRLLSASKLDEGQRRLLDALEISNSGLLFLLNDILDLSKIEAGAFIIESASFEPRLLVSESIRTLEPLAEAKEILISLSVGADLPATLMGDAYRIRQVLLNLLSNAIKFTKKGQIAISIDASLSDDVSTWSLTVTDSGIGMSSEVMQRIFHPFIQGDSSTERKFGGSGLGLAISQEIIELMNGTLEVQSSEGVGSTFVIKLPLIRGASIAKSISQLNIDTPPIEQDCHRGLRVLLAEDNPVNRLVTTGMLRQLGIVPDIANDGRDAVNKAMEVDYDVILMDIHMPGMDGFQATKIICSRKRHRPFIIALTADVTSQKREKCLKNGMDSFLPKPFELKQLKGLIISSTSSEVNSSLVDRRLRLSESGSVRLMLAMEETFEGERDLRKRVLQSYVEQLPKEISGLREGLLLKDREMCLNRIHSIKGMIGSLGLGETLSLRIEVFEAHFQNRFVDHDFRRVAEDLIDDLSLHHAELQALQDELSLAAAAFG